MRLSIRRKLWAVCFSTLIFTVLLDVFINAFDVVHENNLLIALGIGLSVSLFEEFYVQGRPGRWFRAIHPAVAICLYGSLIVIFAMTVMMTLRAGFGHNYDAIEMAAHHDLMPPVIIVLPGLFLVSIIAIMTLRIIGYHGAKNLFHLMVGKYFRPVLEKRIFLFLDIKGSTAIVEELGSIKARSFIGKFFFDISGPITDWGGEVYRFTGDGAVIVWDWEVGLSNDNLVHAIDAISDAVQSGSTYYLDKFGQVPKYRIGVHGGQIVTSEEGDTRRAIGFYGDTIHIAARLERKAKELGTDCLISGPVVKHLADEEHRLKLVTVEAVRGISTPVDMYELIPRHAKIDEGQLLESSSSHS